MPAAGAISAVVEEKSEFSRDKYDIKLG
jgi:hypothetical protein